MDCTFDYDYWDEMWSGDRAAAMSTSPANPHLKAQVRDLAPGTAIDAGCGAGAEAIWLAEQGWRVTAADIAHAALAFGRDRAEAAGVGDGIDWVQADLSTWQPEDRYDLVTTHYAHPNIPQLAFYERIAGWVAHGGTLLVVGHLHPDRHETHGQHRHGSTHGHGHGRGHAADHERAHGDEAGVPPVEASATAATITALLDPTVWEVETAVESRRTMTGPGGRQNTIRDVVVRATRRS